ncbi:MAG: DUF1003 domain-containing protein [Cyclobacteriaceae bacterium]|nr:DUF1003 domain-containing protein [Cyclobacteriaceae bacterium]
MEKIDEYVQELLNTENQHLNKLHKIVTKSIEEEELLSRELSERQGKIKLTFAERLADRVASFGGSWTFIIWFGATIFIWILLNTVFFAKGFDPYPFILLNLILSCIAAIQAPVIMMSQNRQEKKDRQRNENDYLINLKAEMEIRSLNEKMDLSLVDQFKHLCDIQQKQLEMLMRIQSMLEKK